MGEHQHKFCCQEFADDYNKLFDMVSCLTMDNKELKQAVREVSFKINCVLNMHELKRCNYPPDCNCIGCCIHRILDNPTVKRVMEKDGD